MASETTVVSNHSPAPEQVEKVNEEIKKVEQESSFLSKTNGEEENLKAEELPRQPAPASEVEEKIEDKKIESCLAQEVKKTDDTPVLEVSVEDKSDTSGVPESVADGTKSQPEDQPTIGSVENPTQEQPKIEAVEKQLEEAPKMVDVSDPSVVADSAKSQPEKQLETESVEKKPEDQPPVDTVEKQPEEQTKVGDTPNASVEAVEKTEQLEVLPVKESETVVVKDNEDSEAEPRKEEIPKQLTEVEDKPKEQSEAAEKVEKEFEGVEPKETLNAEIEKDEEASAGKVEDPLLKEEQTDKEEPIVTDKPLEQSDAAENFEEECVGVEPKETLNAEIEKDEEASAVKVEDPLLKEEQTDKEEPVVMDKLLEQSEAAEKVEEECAGVEPKGTLNAEIGKGEEQTDKEEPVVTDKPVEQSEAPEKIEEECAGVEPKETIKVEIAKDEAALAGKVEDPVLKEVQTDKEEPVVTDKAQEQSEATKKVEEEYAGVEPKGTKEVEIEKGGESLAGKIEDPLLKEEQTDKEEPVVTDKPQEQSESAEKVKAEYAGVEPKESAKVEIEQDGDASAGKIEDPLLKEEQTDKEEPVVTDKPHEESEAAEKVEEHAGVEPKETAKVEIAKDEEALAGKIEGPLLKEELTNQEKPVVTDKPQEQSEAAENFEEECAGIEPEESLKVELESEEKSVKTEEENEEKKFITEESDEPKTNKVEDITSSIAPTDVTEKSLEVEETSRDIELDAENGKESTHDESVTPVKSEKNGEVEGKVDEVTTITVKEPVEVPLKSETEEEGKETVQTGETNLEKEKESDEIAKPDAAVLESTKEVDENKKTSRELPKEEVPTKPSKQSNTIIAKVKQSLVKAKKAILGKSPNSKTVSSETKGDVKDK